MSKADTVQHGRINVTHMIGTVEFMKKRLQNNAPYKTAVFINHTSWAYRDNEKESEIRRSECIDGFLKQHPEFICERKFIEQPDQEGKESAFSELLDTLEHREYEAVLVRSAADFGAMYGEAAFAIGMFLYPAGIRFIAVEEGFDSFVNDIDAYLIDLFNLNDQYHFVRRHKKRIEKGGMIQTYVPYGYIYRKGEDPEVVIDPETADNVRLIYDLREKGYSYSKIANELNRIGAKTFRQRKEELYGKKAGGMNNPTWIYSTVTQVLQNPFYTGVYLPATYNDKRRKEDKRDAMPGHHEAIITKEQFQRIEEKRKKGKNIGPITIPPIRGKLKCGYCGASMHCNSKMESAPVRNGSIYCLTNGNLSGTACQNKPSRMNIFLRTFSFELDNKIRKAAKYKARLDRLEQSGMLEGYVRLGEMKRSEFLKKMALADGGKEQGLFEQLCRDDKKWEEILKVIHGGSPWIKLFAEHPGMPADKPDPEIVGACLAVAKFYSAENIRCEFMWSESERLLDELIPAIEKEEVSLWAEETAL